MIIIKINTNIKIKYQAESPPGFWSESQKSKDQLGPDQGSDRTNRVRLGPCSSLIIMKIRKDLIN